LCNDYVRIIYFIWKNGMKISKMETCSWKWKVRGKARGW
jgi:hypothetical protein